MTRRRSLVVLLLAPTVAARCDSGGGGGPRPELTDEDGDGFPAAVDCDDSDAQVHPGAGEICNDRDDDCDGTTDGEDSAGAGTFYPDDDVDGWGDTERAVRACAAPAGFVDVGGDCDDGDAGVRPGTGGAAVFERPRIEYFFVGQAPPPEVDPFVLEPGCRDLYVSADVPWLDPVVDATGGRVILFLRREAAVGGVHAGTVTLADRLAGATIGSFAVELRSLGAPGPGLQRRVLVVGADGVRGDSVDPSYTPNLDLLRLNAAWTHRASTQLDAPTVSGPGWTSVLTGVDAGKHGIVSNGGWDAQDPAYPTFLRRVRAGPGVSVVAASNWPPITDEILEPDGADATVNGSDAEVVAAMCGWLASGSHVLHFIALDDPDHAGHTEGFDPSEPAYRAEIEDVDRQLGLMVDAILSRPGIEGEQWMVVYVADHGGTGTGHGCLEPVCRDIPLYVAGPAVFPALPPGFTSHMDVAPTVLDYLGLPPAPEWGLDGRVLGRPFETDCDDGLDDDDDGASDCDDTDCAPLFACTCPESDAASALGSTIASGTTAGGGDDLAGGCGGAGGADVTFSWVAPADDVYTFDLTGSDRDFDTVLYVLRDTCGGEELACNDDASDVQSAVQVPLGAGEGVVLVVDGREGAAGTFEINAEALSACPDRDLGSAVGDAVASGSNAGQGASFFASCARSGRDVALTWTAPSTGTFTIDTRGSDFDTVLHVRDGACAGAEIACSDDAFADYTSEVGLDLAAGRTVTIVVSGFNGRPDGPGPLPAGGTGAYVVNIR